MQITKTITIWAPVIGMILTLGGMPAYPAAGKNETIRKTIDDIVRSYREIIVLSLDENDTNIQQADRASVVGKIIYHENIQRLDQLQSAVQGDDAALETLLEALEKDETLWDADKLAFKGLMDDTLEYLSGRETRNAGLLKRVRDDVKALALIQKRYDDEITDIFSRFGTRAIQPRRELWSEYVGFLKDRFSREAILQKYYSGLLLVPVPRAGQEAEKKMREMFGLDFPKKTLLLTFDDGPHGKYTPRILETLKKYKLKPVFFHVGNNLGEFDKDNRLTLSKTAEISRRLKDEGMLLANHSYSHPVLPKLEGEQITSQIDRTSKLLQAITGEETLFFRAPYGARNETVLASIRASRLRSMMWNIDSRDWADPVPKSIASRVLAEVEKQQRGIILFHDIQPQTVEALPLVLDALIARGYQFAAWNGETFTVDGKSITDMETEVVQSALYRESWAVIIGIDNYLHWPKLKYAVNDALGIKEKLIDKFGFKRENIFVLLNEEATRDNILKLFNDRLADPGLVGEKDRVFVFYAGHGATRKLASGRDLGYLIPVEAHAENFFGESISMTNIGDISEALPARHMLFVMDSCYSGLALTRGGGSFDSTNYIRDNINRIARQMFTAGGADQQVSDSGPNGHSVFTWTLLQGMDGKGDLNRDNYITASELAAYASPIVSSISLQTPAFGNLVGSSGGDFIFETGQRPEFLSELSEQLDEQELTLIAQIDALKDEIQNRRKRNLELKKELLAVKSLLGDVPEDDNETSATRLNEEGLALYRERKHAEALQKFISAAEADSTYSEAMNNAGFMYYKMGRHEEAIYWYKKTILLDDRRAVAWLNLGDAYLAIRAYPEAEAAFKKYLVLQPSSRVSVTVREKLAGIDEEMKH